MEQPISEKDYRSRWDAETLAGAKEIEADPARLAKALTAATKLAEEDSKKARHMRQVAGRKKSGGNGSPYAQPQNSNKRNQKSGIGGTHNVFQRI